MDQALLARPSTVRESACFECYATIQYVCSTATGRRRAHWAVFFVLIATSFSRCHCCVNVATVTDEPLKHDHHAGAHDDQDDGHDGDDDDDDDVEEKGKRK